MNIERLEQALRLWEDICFSKSASMQVYAGIGQTSHPDFIPIEGPLVHYKELRQALLDIHDHPFNQEKFVCSPAQASSRWTRNTCYRMPLLFASWAYYSRRIYQVSDELEQLLLATSLDGVRWNDIIPPFMSFAVSLTTPLKDKMGSEYDFVTYHTRKGVDGEFGVFTILSTDFEKATPIPLSDRLKVTEAIRKKKWWRASGFADKILKGLTVASIREVAFDLTKGDEYVLDTLAGYGSYAEGCNEEGSDLSVVWNQMTRLVVGLCLYMQTLPSATPHKSEWQPVERKKGVDLTAITDGAQVCLVSSTISLTANDLDVLRKQNTKSNREEYELKTHFREGHWRRPPGKGNDPLYPKTVWVKPTIVRADRRAEHSLPSGTMKMVA